TVLPARLEEADRAVRLDVPDEALDDVDFEQVGALVALVVRNPFVGRDLDGPARHRLRHEAPPGSRAALPLDSGRTPSWMTVSPPKASAAATWYASAFRFHSSKRGSLSWRWWPSPVAKTTTMRYCVAPLTPLEEMSIRDMEALVSTPRSRKSFQIGSSWSRKPCSNALTWSFPTLRTMAIVSMDGPSVSVTRSSCNARRRACVQTEGHEQVGRTAQDRAQRSLRDEASAQ